ncbi:MAG: TIGR02285 family protein [Desulfobacteraceae bacterium]|jgi:uncharacterized protein (TIGR02285 family)
MVKVPIHTQKVIITIMLAFFTLLGNASGQTVVWAVADRPTSYILEGEDKGKGAVDEVYALLQENLTEYQHKNQEMTFARIIKQMEHGKNVCACGFKKPEREEVGIFSQPAIISVPFSIVTKKKHLPEMFNNVDSISLEKLLKNKSITCGVTQKRSYGSITELINIEQNKNISVHTNTSNLTKMLLLDRVDYIIEIPSFPIYMAKQLKKEDPLLNQNQDPLVSIGIEENTNKVLLASIFCTKNQWGNDIMKKIDDILSREKAKPQYLKMLERWYDEKSRLVIRKHYNTEFINAK